jgi:hypothetical protein
VQSQQLKCCVDGDIIPEYQFIIPELLALMKNDNKVDENSVQNPAKKAKQDG